jgi:hypothetical protein
MPFSSMILPRTLSVGHAWLSKRVGRSKNRHRESRVATFKTKNDLSEEIRAEAIEPLNARLADCNDLQTQRETARRLSRPGRFRRAFGESGVPFGPVAPPRRAPRLTLQSYRRVCRGKQEAAFRCGSLARAERAQL